MYKMKINFASSAGISLSRNENECKCSLYSLLKIHVARCVTPVFWSFCTVPRLRIIKNRFFPELAVNLKMAALKM
jgi:hypothetical protein